ncbi:antibiotic biosynthesis monooxygenase family protein [Pedococcus bigeumensis]|uniref:Antibiotic biosynthesis monooxygenase n=1 Tax=Pedococcus bigeumensis TaxID=433644 RepID=A0A502CMS7_9MICO|nr:antibiotic biosynthesis monooxygenase [Pedococcus bigeumensis]TPG13439.1 antibiotic biosynthesis monooxygenase [Pedococcus bigeumensis]
MADGDESTYVSVSHLRIAEEEAPGLIQAFRQRVHLVDSALGFQRLEVWQGSEPGEILMVSWWRDRECFKAYMRSPEHRTSHDRITPELRDHIKLERLQNITSYQVVAE